MKTILCKGFLGFVWFFFKCLVISFGDGQVFSTNSLTGFSSKLLCDFPIIYGLFSHIFFSFHNWEVPVNSNHAVCIFSKYSYSKCDVGLLT